MEKNTSDRWGSAIADKDQTEAANEEAVRDRDIEEERREAMEGELATAEDGKEGAVAHGEQVVEKISDEDEDLEVASFTAEMADEFPTAEDKEAATPTAGRSESLTEHDQAATDEPPIDDKESEGVSAQEVINRKKVPLNTKKSSVINLGDYKSLSNTPIDCYRLGTYARDMIVARAEIEQEYARTLNLWEATWRNIPIKQYPQDNTLRMALDAFLDEAVAVCKLQTNLSRYLAYSGKQITEWMKANITWTVLGGCREKKDLERDFKRIQGFWKKLLGDVEKAKAAYHASLKKAQQNSKESEHTTAKDSKITIEIANNEEIYKNLIKDAEKAKDEYLQQMNSVYRKCGRMEKNKELAIGRALKMIKRKLHDHQEHKMKSVYKTFIEAVEAVDVESDLENWEKEKGVNDEPQVPTFEAECSEGCSCQHPK